MTNFLQGTAAVIVASCVVCILSICLNRALNHDDMYPLAVVALLAVTAFMVAVIYKLEMVIEAERHARAKR